jgi:hypothetical protein
MTEKYKVFLIGHPNSAHVSFDYSYDEKEKILSISGKLENEQLIYAFLEKIFKPCFSVGWNKNYVLSTLKRTTELKEFRLPRGREKLFNYQIKCVLSNMKYFYNAIKYFKLDQRIIRRSFL